MADYPCNLIPVFRIIQSGTGAASIAYITGAPEIPKLEARIGNGSLTGLTVEWSMDVVTERGERNTQDNVHIPQTDAVTVVEVPIDQPWRIYDKFIAPLDFFGGKCTLNYQIKDAAGNYMTPVQKYQFAIRGKNPKYDNANAYIESTQGGYRFAWPMIQHESREGQRVYNQFNPSGGTKELPNFGAPDGWGIAQLDKPFGISASTREVYNWMGNIAKFYGELVEKTGAQQRFFDAVQRTYPNNYEEPPDNFVHSGTSTSMTAMEAGVVTLYNGVAQCPNSTLKGASGKLVVFQNPWEYNPSAPSGRKWSYTPNQYNYLKKIIYDEFEGHSQKTE